jgi:ABC-type multidrug transport system fused ATPase/permease subunit
MCQQVQHQRRVVAAEKTDARVTTINEVLLAIRAVKLYAWETLFAARISENRQEELVFIRKLGINKAYISTLANVSPSLVTLAALLFFTAVAGHELDAATVFTSIALFENMKDPLARLPDRITSFVDLAVASDRLQTFLARDEVAPRSRCGGGGHDLAIRLDGGSFGWGWAATDVDPKAPKRAHGQGKAKKASGDRQYQQLEQDEEATLLASSSEREAPALLRDITLQIAHGELVYVIGTVGSGKSNLLAAILSEMVPAGGSSSTAVVDGRCAFVDQQPWILNMSLRQNVLVSGPQEPVDEARYQEALRVTGLLEDLDALPGGDHTEIGERGINISGGQKQRVCLARLVYSEASICLLDDPTSALDAVMAAHVFEQCVHGTLERQRRTRLIVTNVVEPSVLRRADRVVWMDDGRIRACCPFDEMVEQGGGDDGGAFSALLAVQPRQKQEEAAAPSSTEKKAQAGASTAVSLPSAAGKLVKAEDRETGTVASAVYSRLFTSAGVGYCCATGAAFVVSTASQTGKDWYIAYWTNSDQAGAGVWSFLGTFIFLTLAFALLTLARAAMLVNVGYFCSIKIHRQMAHAVLYSPLSFFDVTPTGRVLNRFAKDTENVDVKVWESWRGFLDLLFPMVGTLLLVCAVTPAFALAIPVLGLLAVRVQNYYRRTSRELKRLSSIARSPMYDWFSCTLDGLSTIRAHDMSATFTAENSERSDEANKMQYIQKICDRWLGTRLEMMGNLMCFVAMLLGVAARGQTSRDGRCCHSALPSTAIP